MTTHKTISSLAFAGIALLAAAVPSFSQVNSRDRHTGFANVSSATGRAFEVAVNSNPFSALPNVSAGTIESKNVVEPPAESKTTLAPAAFKFTGEDKLSFSPRFKVYDAPSINSKKQFRADDEDVPRSRNRVTFVPSRGQKIPS